MPPRILTNFEIQKYYVNESKFNGVLSRNNLPKIKNRAYVINLGEYISVGSHWIALYLHCNMYTEYFKHISKEFKKFIGSKKLITNIHRIQAFDSIMCRCFCILFNEFFLKRKSFLDCTNLYFPKEYEKMI